MIKRVVGIYYSPAEGAAKMTRLLVGAVARKLNDCSAEDISAESIALSDDAELPDINEEAIVVLGMPAYIGKIPLPAIKTLKYINGSGAMTLGLVAYGGRDCGNALYELTHYAEERGLAVIGAGAISIKYKACSKRFDKNAFVIDTETLDKYADAAASKIIRLGGCEIEGLRVKPAPLEVRGRMPVHRFSRIYPSAAAVAQALLNRVPGRRMKSEWYL